MAQISLRVDDDVKRGAEQVFDDIGLTKYARFPHLYRWRAESPKTNLTAVVGIYPPLT